MIYLVAVLTLLLAVSYTVYRTAKTERAGFMALVAWVVLAGLDIAALAGWAIWAAVHSQ